MALEYSRSIEDTDTERRFKDDLRLPMIRYTYSDEALQNELDRTERAPTYISNLIVSKIHLVAKISPFIGPDGSRRIGYYLGKLKVRVNNIPYTVYLKITVKAEYGVIAIFAYYIYQNGRFLREVREIRTDLRNNGVILPLPQGGREITEEELLEDVTGRHYDVMDTR